MEERLTASGRDESAIVIELTPRNYRRQAICFIGLGVVMLAVSVVLFVYSDRDPSPLVPLAAIGYGVYCARQARRQVTRTLLTIDRAGIRSGDGTYDCTWAGVVLIWVGWSTGLRLPVLSQPVLHVFTQAGVEVAQRAGTPPKALFSLPVGGAWRVSDLCARLETITEAAVVDGTRVSRRSAAADLTPTVRV